MPTYDYRCDDCGDFEMLQKIADHGWATCPTCDTIAKQILTRPPSLDIEGMADAGCPGAFETSGDRMTKRHQDADRAGDWASRDSTEFTDSVGEDRKGDFMKAFEQKVKESDGKLDTIKNTNL
jgi:putative FmdB family regulatory protein